MTWLPHCRRSDGIAGALGGRSHLVHHLEHDRPAIAPVRYLLQAATTLRHLRRDRPPLVLVNTPPVVAALVVWAWCAATGTPFVIDAHTGTFDDPRWRWARPLHRWLSRRAATTIVTSEHLAAQVRGWGADALVVGTVPVTFTAAPPAALGPGAHVVVVSTFSRDEPLDVVFQAARDLPDVSFHVTGDAGRAPAVTASAPDNVRFTGWLSDEDYHGLLQAADVVACLTTRDHTMQRGGYEAMAVGRPLITSDWPLLRRTFSEGTLHVDNTATDLVRAVREALASGAQLEADMHRLAARRGDEFTRALDRLVTIPPKEHQ